MKRTISVLLAAVLLLGVMGACGEKGNRSGIWYELAGIDPQAVAVEADGVSLPAELYCYWFVFNASMMEYRAYLYADEREEFANIRSPRTRLNWDAPFGNGTVLDYVLDETLETIRFYMTIEALAARYGIVLTEEDRAAIEEERASAAQSMGGEEGFDRYLERTGISRESYERINGIITLFDRLEEESEREGSPIRIGPEELDAFALCTDHIYIATVNLTNYASLDAASVERKRALAEELVSRLQAADDPAALFKELADEYSEDPYRAEAPDGYVYARGTMNAAYEAAAGELPPNGISGVVEGATGFYIIHRMDLMERLESDPDRMRSIREECLTDRIRKEAERMDWKVSRSVRDIDAAALYQAYVARNEQAEREAAAD